MTYYNILHAQKVKRTDFQVSSHHTTKDPSCYKPKATQKPLWYIIVAKEALQVMDVEKTREGMNPAACDVMWQVSSFQSKLGQDKPWWKENHIHTHLTESLSKAHPSTVQLNWL